MIRFLFAIGLSETKINWEIVAMYSVNPMTFKGVSDWWQEFKTGHMSVID